MRSVFRGTVAFVLLIASLLLAPRGAAARTWLPLGGAEARALAEPAPASVPGDAAAIEQAADQQLPDTSLAVPWLGVIWQSFPNLTWSACDLAADTRTALNIAIQQWQYAAAYQGVPVQFSEMPCTNGKTQAQIRVSEASSSSVGNAGLPASMDLLGLTLVQDARGRICGIDVTGPCVAQIADSYLFTDNWQKLGLSDAQEAKTIAHEFGHAVGLAVPHFCTFDSLMAQDCEPILPGLGPDDIQSINALVSYSRSYFGQSQLNVQPAPTPVSGTGLTVMYHAGWNLVAGPRGTGFAAASGSLLTYLPGDSSYESFPPSQLTYNGYGYWAYFPRDTTIVLNGGSGKFYSVDAPAGEWFLIGNENGTTPMRVIGAASVQTYDPQSGQYQSTSVLQPGQAAWVQPDRNAFIAVAATTLADAQVSCYLKLGNPTSCG